MSSKLAHSAFYLSTNHVFARFRLLLAYVKSKSVHFTVLCLLSSDKQNDDSAAN